MRKKRGAICALAVAMFFAVTPLADAHVTVQPTDSTTGAYEKYTVRVPVEKDIPTTQVQLKVPKEVELVSVMPISGWEYKTKKDDEGRITSIRWKAKDGGIKAGEFMEFSFVGANPQKPGKIAWKARQTYKDGSVVKWEGPPDSDQPASMTQIATGEGHRHGSHDDDTKPSTQEEADAKEGAETEGPNTSVPTILAGAALLLAMISLFRKRS
ncbi:YcnI family copper-binding membrane protein [Salinithrix halophila]|uniref:YcnI family protein n=1 Tax=Salinithrix halophila TaxID=1485204 RepID=A0ABV8JCU5_9BACL